MKVFIFGAAAAFFLFFPTLGRAQNTGRIECARDDGYVYLYSSITTLDVRATLQCGEMVYIINRDENYFIVRNPRGETGFVPMASIVVLKDQPGTGLPVAEPKARERIHYDNSSRESDAPAKPNVSGFTLLSNTRIRVKLAKTISSASAHVGDTVEFEVLEDTLVEGVPVLMKGAKATGVIAQAESKKRFGHSGKLAFTITSVRLADGEQAAVRCYQEASGASNTSAGDGVLPLGSGKDVAIPQDTEFVALVDGDVHLKREAFAEVKNDASARDAAPAQLSSQPKP